MSCALCVYAGAPCGGSVRRVAMISTLLLGLALRVGANAAATPHPTYTVSGAGDPIADGVYVATRADAKTFAATGRQAEISAALIHSGSTPGNARKNTAMSAG